MCVDDIPAKLCALVTATTTKAAAARIPIVETTHRIQLEYSIVCNSISAKRNLNRFLFQMVLFLLSDGTNGYSMKKKEDPLNRASVECIYSNYGR